MNDLEKTKFPYSPHFSTCVFGKIFLKTKRRHQRGTTRATYTAGTWSSPPPRGSRPAKADLWLAPRSSLGGRATTSSSLPRGLGGKHQPIKARSLLFAAHGKCFQGLGGKNQPIKARSLFFAAHGKCFQVSMAHKPAGASSFSFKDLVYFTWLLKVTATWTQLTANLSSSFHGLQASKHQFVFPQRYRGTCPGCQSPEPSLFHSTWACPSLPGQGILPIPDPSFTFWEAALSSAKPEDQRMLISRAKRIAEANGALD
ncbi:uncharacterized protein ISCGN_002520 [Ixodes scapularis]